MVEKPWSWSSSSGVQPETEYLALISYLPRKGFMTIFSFRQSGAIQDQLKTSEGLIGYSMRVQLLGPKAWTLSVWKDQDALASFVRASPHFDSMRKLRPHLGKTKFVRWNVKGSDLPPKWDDALRRLES